MSDETPEAGTSPHDLFKIYEDGKHRRYALLFSVNGGAFTVAQLVAKTPRELLGSLTLRQLAVGMIAFTAVMVFDIYKFGMGMSGRTHGDVFHSEGKVVLLLIGLLICLGWAAVAL
jgi:hypothetical protein